MNGVGKRERTADESAGKREKSGRLWGEGERVRSKTNGVGGRRLRTDPEGKEKKCEVME